MKSLSDIQLPADPNAALEAATKQYADDVTSFEKLMLELGFAEVLTASENLTANRIVFADNGSGTVYLADADNSRPCNGYVLQSVTSGNPVTVYYAGTPILNVTGFGVAVGANLYTSNSAGFLAPTPGTIEQYVGIALNAASGLPTAQKVRFAPAEWK